MCMCVCVCIPPNSTTSLGDEFYNYILLIYPSIYCFSLSSPKENCLTI